LEGWQPADARIWGGDGRLRPYELDASYARRSVKPQSSAYWVHRQCVGKVDRCGNLYSTKSRLDQKIDAAAALMMAIGRSILEGENQAGPNRFLSDPIALSRKRHRSGYVAVA